LWATHRRGAFSISNRTQGFRKARGLLASGELGPPVAEADRAPLATRQTCARLIRKIFEVDLLRCPRCGATLKVIAVIEDDEVIYRSLSHLNLLSSGDGSRPPPRTEGPRELIYEPGYDDVAWPDPA
jgi:hypothetical protein